LENDVDREREGQDCVIKRTVLFCGNLCVTLCLVVRNIQRGRMI
jgi:hypothetical protein